MEQLIGYDPWVFFSVNYAYFVFAGACGTSHIQGGLHLGSSKKRKQLSITQFSYVTIICPNSKFGLDNNSKRQLRVHLFVIIWVKKYFFLLKKFTF